MTETPVTEALEESRMLRQNKVTKEKDMRRDAYPFLKVNKSEEVIDEVSGTGKLSDNLSSKGA